MKSKASVAFAVLAGVGVSACSPSKQNVHNMRGVPTEVRQYQAVYTPVNPAGQHLSNAFHSNRMPDLTTMELHKIGEMIFRNEGGGKATNLVHWNDGEDFAALGIGHFTWYPKGRKARFGDTFPELLTYLESQGTQVPAWLKRDGAPWRTRAELMRAKHTAKGRELQNFLDRTRLLQTRFIVDRTRRAAPKLVNAAPHHMRTHVRNNLNAVANTPGGWYALIDYTNFKGEGLGRPKDYNGQNWGLLQVLEEMRPSRPGQQALHEFADAAMRVLERRVRNSPPARNERRWLAGWSNRVNTYRRLLV